MLTWMQQRRCGRPDRLFPKALSVLGGLSYGHGNHRLAVLESGDGRVTNGSVGVGAGWGIRPCVCPQIETAERRDVLG